MYNVDRKHKIGRGADFPLFDPYSPPTPPPILAFCWGCLFQMEFKNIMVVKTGIAPKRMLDFNKISVETEHQLRFKNDILIYNQQENIHTLWL